MPKPMITIACIDLRLKRALVEALKTMEEADAEFDSSTYLQSLKDMPDCSGDKPIEFTEEGTKTERNKSSRPPSAYQQHTGECMRAGHTMKECAAIWREKKAKGVAR